MRFSVGIAQKEILTDLAVGKNSERVHFLNGVYLRVVNDLIFYAEGIKSGIDLFLFLHQPALL